MTSSSWAPTKPGETVLIIEMLRNLSIMYFSKNPSPSGWFTNSIHFFQSVCLCELSTAVCTQPAKNVDPRRALWALQYMDCPEPASQSCSAGEREEWLPGEQEPELQVPRPDLHLQLCSPSMNSRKQETTAKEIKGNCAVQEQEVQDVNQQHLRSSK